MKQPAPLVLALLLSLAGGTAVGEDGPAFSRSRWITEQRAWGARFSGGVLPTDRERLQALVDSLGSQAPARRPPVAHYTRISQDILTPDNGPAEPETQTEPSVAVDPQQDNHLLAGYQESRFATGGARALTYAVSRDSGRNWSEGLVPGLTAASGGPYERASDPWVAFGPGGRAYYAALALNETSRPNGIYVSVSEDGGSTWGDPAAVHTTSTELDDKDSVVVDTRSDSPFLGRVYVAWDSITPDHHQAARLSHSTDGGASFTPFVTLHNQGGNIGVIPLVGPGGVVHAVWASYRTERTADLLSARSEDGGDTWTAPVAIAVSIHSAGVKDSRTADGLPSTAVDPRTGDLYVVWQEDRFSPGVDQVVLSLSSDGGATWSEPQLVSDGPLDAPNFTPAVAVNGKGLVGVAYYSLRNDPGRHTFADEYLAVSRDHGKSFGRSTRMSPLAWDLGTAAVADGGFFLGDYQGLAANRKTFFPVWIATFLPSRRDPHQTQPDAFTWPLQAR